MNPKIATALLATVSAQDTAPGFSLDQIIKFSAGLIEGVLDINHLEEMTKCFGDAEYTAGEMFTIVEDIKTKDIQKIMEALTHTGNIFLHFPTTLMECTSMTADVKRLAAWAAPFKNPKEEMPAIWANLLTNYAVMIHDLDLMNQAITAEDHQSAGKFVSDILVQGLGPIADLQPESLPVTQW